MLGDPLLESQRRVLQSRLELCDEMLEIFGDYLRQYEKLIQVRSSLINEILSLSSNHLPANDYNLAGRIQILGSDIDIFSTLVNQLSQLPTKKEIQNAQESVKELLRKMYNHQHPFKQSRRDNAPLESFWTEQAKHGSWLDTGASNLYMIPENFQTVERDL